MKPILCRLLNRPLRPQGQRRLRRFSSDSYRRERVSLKGWLFNMEDKMYYRRLVLGVIGVVFMANEALAGMDIFVYPSKGQTKEQQEQDEFGCYKWAKEQTGFDPTQPVQQATAPPPKGGAVKGAAGGAAIGAVGGAIAGDAGKGAAIGAGVGALGGSLTRKKSQQQQQAAQQQAKQQYEANANGYKRAYSACMTGRGYTVN
jgi:hypothetical protein